jgi:DNA-directed RNA polymerase subunit M/transcription elongation factor TFIIS
MVKKIKIVDVIPFDDIKNNIVDYSNTVYAQEQTNTNIKEDIKDKSEEYNITNDVIKPEKKTRKKKINNPPDLKEEPIKEEPIKEEPIKEEPIKEEPIKEEPIKEEPIKEDIKDGPKVEYIYTNKKYIICEKCGAKLLEKSYKYSHKNNCKYNKNNDNNNVKVIKKNEEKKDIQPDNDLQQQQQQQQQSIPQPIQQHNIINRYTIKQEKFKRLAEQAFNKI